MMSNQPALRTSSGNIWLICSSIFVVLCLIPLVSIAMSGGNAATVALVCTVLLIALLAAAFVVRFAVPPYLGRLRWLAMCMLAMALVALLGMVLCVLLVWSGVPR